MKRGGSASLPPRTDDGGRSTPRFGVLVRAVGVEPTYSFESGVLKPVRIPVPPRPRRDLYWFVRAVLRPALPIVRMVPLGGIDGSSSSMGSGVATCSKVSPSAFRILRVTAREVGRPEKKRLTVLRLMPLDLAMLCMLSSAPWTCLSTSARRHRTRSSVYRRPRYRTVASLGRRVVRGTNIGPPHGGGRSPRPPTCAK